MNRSVALDQVFLGWLVLTGLVLFGVFLLHQYGLLAGLWLADSTRLSLLILLLFFVTTAYLGRCAWWLGRQLVWSAQDASPSSGVAQEHRQLLAAGVPEGLLVERLGEKVLGAHQAGWFMADLLIKLGMVGTVIGFILMLASVSDLNEQNIQVLKQLLTRMSGGMQVALYTTLTGLICSLLLSLQCQWLDRFGDRLVSRIIEQDAGRGLS